MSIFKLFLSDRLHHTVKQNVHCTVMHPNWNSFWGDVVLGSFNKASRDEENILDQIYGSKYVWIFIMIIFSIFLTLYENSYLHKNSNKIQLYEFLVVICCISLKMNFLQFLSKFQIFIISPKKIAFYTLSLKCCLHSFLPC